MVRETRHPPQFDAAFRAQFAELVRWRRDVRRFRSACVPPELVSQLLELASHAPSVGLSQPWRFVLVETPERRGAIRDNFARANKAALDGYQGERQARYARLKLEGLSQAPVHLAVCADEATAQGAGLGRQTMPETIRYSVVAAIQTLWLGARRGAWRRLGVDPRPRRSQAYSGSAVALELHRVSVPWLAGSGR